MGHLLRKFIKNKEKKHIISFAKIKTLIMDINEFDWNKYDEEFVKLPSFRQEKINKLTNTNDKKLSFLAGYLIHNEIGDKDKLIQINESGKEYIPENAFYFSISHSLTKVIVVFSSYPIGVDIESLSRVVDLDIAKKFFNKEEYQDIISSKKQDETFIKYWTIKESYLKCVGSGLNKPLDSIIIKKDKISDSNYDIYQIQKTKDNYLYSIVIKKEN